ncbi:low molecular weight phosphatase family protein [Nocardia sp. NPDC049190]|uniref:arsenate reductase/protein-tyrosine-phosphatase family protein n=1 Tax=Nocardia sp. NPDC049190 TaxID=3155650 RepID=UPI0033CADA05
MHVLFVCNGNVCRSVIAERLTRALAVEHGLPHLTAESAGTRALVGFPVEPLAAQAIIGLGADPGDFRARRLTPAMIDDADLILAMTEKIRDQIVGLGFGAQRRTFTLVEAHRIAHVTGARTVGELHRARNNLTLVGRENIADPVGLSAPAFCEVGDRIAGALIPLLLALAPQEQPRTHEDDRAGLALRPDAGPAPLAVFLAAQRTH